MYLVDGLELDVQTSDLLSETCCGQARDRCHRRGIADGRLTDVGVTHVGTEPSREHHPRFPDGHIEIARG